MTNRRSSTATRDADHGRLPDDSLESLEDLDAETVEDLDVDDDAADVRGGTTFNCPTSH
jgi:hypothetical protein